MGFSLPVICIALIALYLSKSGRWLLDASFCGRVFFGPLALNFNYSNLPCLAGPSSLEKMTLRDKEVWMKAGRACIAGVAAGPGGRSSEIGQASRKLGQFRMGGRRGLPRRRRCKCGRLLADRRKATKKRKKKDIYIYDRGDCELIPTDLRIILRTVFRWRFE